MSMKVVTGGAGTGKTTRLIAHLEARLAQAPLQDDQRVLALTFMHGSRQQLTGRLSATSARNHFHCTTFDGFAREICRRWRTRLHGLGHPLPTDEGYDEVCSAAAALLSSDVVARWVSASYPIVIVDEFQDCYGDRPGLVSALSRFADVFIAADPFQDLRNEPGNPALAMIASIPDHEELTTVHRTRKPALLACATALRTGSKVSVGPGLALKFVPNEHLAASGMCLAIKTSRGSTAVISSSPPKNPKSFAVKVLNAAATTKGYGKANNIGPYPVRWETSVDGHKSELLESLEILGASARPAGDIVSALPSRNPLASYLEHWLDKQRRLYGRDAFTALDLRSQLPRAEAAVRSMTKSGNGLRAMTVHQAKNREFENVIVLWAYQVPGDVELQRRWLYNAVTRAKTSATIIVHGLSRASAPLFVGHDGAKQLASETL